MPGSAQALPQHFWTVFLLVWIVAIFVVIALVALEIIAQRRHWRSRRLNIGIGIALLVLIIASIIALVLV